MTDVISEREKRRGPRVKRSTRERNIERGRAAGRRESTGAATNGSGRADMFRMSGAESAAEGGEAFGSVRFPDLLLAGARATLRGGTLRATGRLLREGARIAGGRSEIQPPKGDWRFKDPTWTENILYRRLMQLYLAWSEEVSRVALDADLDWRDAERARFLATLLTTTLAPTNTIAGNPEALKRLLETGGTSVLRGARNVADDLRHNNGMPSQVDRRAFTLGDNLAVTPGSVVYRDEVLELIQYAPSTPRVHARPIVMIPPQINKYYFMDLAKGRSFVENAVSHGLQFFAVSWRNPGRSQSDWNLDTYAEAVLRAIDVARDITGSDDVNTLSLCAGGITTAAVLGHLAATGDTRVRSASFGVTLLDFETPAPLGLFDAPPVLSLARRSSRGGVLEGRTLASVFTWMRPNDLVWNYFVNNYLLGNDPPTFDILAWNSDPTNLPRALHADFLRVFADNALATPGALTCLGTPIDLGEIEVETYVTGATTDHLTPWRGCYQTTQLMAGPSTFILSSAGHIASLINPPGNPKSHFFAGPEPTVDAETWKAQADKRQGTWWEHWAQWIAPRSGAERRAPNRTGSRRYPVIEPAPGSYVRGREPEFSPSGG